jgi:hypothetical protein
MTDRDAEPPPEDPPAPPGELVLAEEGGVRVFYISAPTMADLVDRLALVLGEHMHDDDELHVTYNAMQNGWTNHPPKKGHVLRAPTRLDRTALRILRLRRPTRPRPTRARPTRLTRLVRCSARRLYYQADGAPNPRWMRVPLCVPVVVSSTTGRGL